MLTIEQRVQNGIDLLHSLRPGWYDHVDLDRLNLSHCLDCVLGQLFNGYMSGYIFLLQKVERWFNPSDYGFTSSDFLICLSHIKNEFEILTREWKTRIKELRDADRTSRLQNPTPFPTYDLGGEA